MRKLTSSMRAVFSARSMSRAIQNRFSAVRLSMAQRSSTQVSLVPPPWLELTTSEPLRSATRVRPPEITLVSLPESTKGLRSTCRGTISPSISVGAVDSASVGWAI